MTIKSALALCIGLFFLITGILHIVHPQPLIAIVPPWLPKPALVVFVSGFFEIIGGFGFLLAPLRKSAGIGLILLLIAVFPANIYMLTSHPYLMEQRIPDWILWVRLPLQALLIALIWWCADSKIPAHHESRQK
ncbi:MAG: hypothetical protein ABIP97_02185 [Chthoniobacterales bacterium]